MSSPKTGQEHIGRFLRFSLAAASVAILISMGSYAAWRTRDDLYLVLLSLAETLGPAAVCAFGYFVCMPEVLGAEVASDKGGLRERWSGFVRLAAAIAGVITLVGWSLGLVVAPDFVGPDWQAVSAHPRDFAIFVIRRVWVLVLVLLSSLLTLAVAVASEEYLLRTMPDGCTASGTGWRAGIRRWVGRWGGWFLKRFPARVALVLGGAMVLASLVLTMEADWPALERGGYMVFLYARGLPPAYNTVQGMMAHSIVARAEQGMYVIALLAGLVALVAVLMRRRGNVVRQSRALLIAAGVLAVFGTTDYAFGLQRLLTCEPILGFQSPAERLMENISLTVWLIVFVLPIVLWFARARQGGKHWDHTRIAAMILYLPIFLFALAWLPFIARLVPGYAAFWIGLLFLWWGFLQSCQEGVSLK